MGLSRRLDKQALLSFSPTEATSPVLDLILSLFMARFLTFESLVAQLHLFCAADHHPNLTSLK